MLSEERIAIIYNILHSPTENEEVDLLIKEYAKQKRENASILLRLIPIISAIADEHHVKEVAETKNALDTLLVYRYAPKVDKRTKFAMMVQICKVLFPSGTANGGSNADKKFFKEFLDLFNDTKAFSWEEDKLWADSFEYTDYLKLVEKSNENL